MNKNPFFIFLVIAICASGILTCYLAHRYFKEKQQMHHTMQETAQKSLDSIVTFFEQRLTEVAKISATLTNDPALKTESMKETEAKFTQTLLDNPSIYGIGIAFDPYVYDKDTRLVSLHLTQNTDKEASRITVEQFYDYTKSDWYLEAFEEKVDWVGPYVETSSGAMITRYAQPLFTTDPTTQEKKIYGVLTIDVSIQEINNILASLNIDKDSYAFITGTKGILIAHPTEHHVLEEKTIFDLAQMPGQADFVILGNEIAKKDSGSLTIQDLKTYKHYRASFQHVNKTDWAVVIVTPETHSLIPSMAIRRSITNTMLAFFLFLFLLSCLLYSFHPDIYRRLWFGSITLAILFGLSTLMLWTFDVISTERKEYHEHIMTNQMAVNRFFYVQKRLNPVIYKKDAHFIPTGLFIYSIDLAETKPDVSFTGHIWQKYNLKKDADLSHGVTLLNAKDQSFEKIYETKDGDILTVGWRFKATIKTSFNFYKYPLDQQNIVLMLGHQDYKANIILTPDFEAFTSTKNIPNPEIDPITNTGQWTTKNTYSFYKLTNYVTNFGIEDYTKQKNFPNLCFNILIRRKFSDPLITNFLPIAIIITIAFAVLIATGLSNERTKDIAALVLPMCSSIFFAAVVGHQTYERTLETSGITYFEYFYFMLYIIILLTTTNGMLYGYNRGGQLLHYRKNLIPRLIYWPVVMFCFFINTFVFFY